MNIRGLILDDLEHTVHLQILEFLRRPNPGSETEEEAWPYAYAFLHQWLNNMNVYGFNEHLCGEFIRLVGKLTACQFASQTEVCSVRVRSVIVRYDSISIRAQTRKLTWYTTRSLVIYRWPTSRPPWDFTALAPNQNSRLAIGLLCNETFCWVVLICPVIEGWNAIRERWKCIRQRRLTISVVELLSRTFQHVVM
jgi:hypothetical protein